MYWNMWAWFSSFFSVPGLGWEACLKKAEVELELFTDTDM